jgi:hypothetical protein
MNLSKQCNSSMRMSLSSKRMPQAEQLHCLPQSVPDSLICTADGATVKLNIQKNGWKGVCVYQKTNRDAHSCPVRALGQQYLHLRHNNAKIKTFLLGYWHEGKKRDVTADNISRALKISAAIFHYPTNKGIPVDRIDMGSLQSGATNTLTLARYLDTQIQKIGQWHGATFKEYIREELAC